MKYKDYYAILGVGRTASQGDIRKAYHKLARKYHPDVSKSAGTEEKFKEVSEAYDVLGEEAKRQKYDQLGSRWQDNQDFTPPPGWQPGGTRYTYRTTGNGGGEDFGGGMGGFSDFFEAMFGGMGGRMGDMECGRSWRGGGEFSSRGQDQEAEIDVTLEDVLRGVRRTLSLQTAEVDPQGRVRRGVKQLNVTIPPGVTEGSRIRLAEQGGAGQGGGPAGNLYLRVHILPHATYQVNDHDLETPLALAPWEAALGAKVPLQILDGSSVMLTIPPGTASGAQLRLRGKGLPRRRGEGQGDLLVTVKIAVPKRLTAREKELFEELGRVSPFRAR